MSKYFTLFLVLLFNINAQAVLPTFQAVHSPPSELQSSGTITWSEDFTQGQATNLNSSQCISWDDFCDLLSPRTYTKFTIKGSQDPTGVSVTDSDAATAIASALYTKGSGSWSSDGRSWRVGSCTNQNYTNRAISASNSVCSCHTNYDIRPCIGNRNWGGIGTSTCNGPSQTMTVVFEY